MVISMSQGYIDIHSHILPGVDDGARDMDMTEELLRAELEEGVTKIIATPHFDLDHNFQDVQEIQDKVAMVQKKASELSDELSFLLLFNNNDTAATKAIHTEMDIIAILDF